RERATAAGRRGNHEAVVWIAVTVAPAERDIDLAGGRGEGERTALPLGQWIEAGYRDGEVGELSRAGIEVEPDQVVLQGGRATGLDQGDRIDDAVRNVDDGRALHAHRILWPAIHIAAARRSSDVGRPLHGTGARIERIDGVGDGCNDDSRTDDERLSIHVVGERIVVQM